MSLLQCCSHLDLLADPCPRLGFKVNDRHSLLLGAFGAPCGIQVPPSADLRCSSGSTRWAFRFLYATAAAAVSWCYLLLPDGPTRVPYCGRRFLDLICAVKRVQDRVEVPEEGLPRPGAGAA